MNSFKFGKRISLGCVFWIAACGTTVDRYLSDDTGEYEAPSTNVQQVKALSFNPEPGTYSSPVSVAVSTSTPGVSIFCTEDGSDPSQSSELYETKIRISKSTLLRCRAYKLGFTPSVIGEAQYLIQKKITPPPGFGAIHVEMSLAVDGKEMIRVQNGIMDLIHVTGDRPENPLVNVTYSDGSVGTLDRWILEPFQMETGITCNWSPAGCVSLSVDLDLLNLSEDGTAYIPPSSLDVLVGRGTVSIDKQNRIVISDSDPGWSGYWFFFDYFYPLKSE